MDNRTKTGAVVLALLAAVFYAINTPFSKVLLANIAPTFMAAFLYLGAGAGVGIMYLFHIKNEEKSERLTKGDMLYTVGISNASLLSNFEIVATTLIALLLFKEKLTGRLWTAIGFITLSSIILSFEGSGSFKFSIGLLFVILQRVVGDLKITVQERYQIKVLMRLFY